MSNNNSTIIPEHKEGRKTDIEASEKCSGIEEAQELFAICKQRLLNINKWGELAGAASADFRLTDDSGKEITRTEAKVGDHFKIDIPGPGTVTGDGYDWVRIEEIEDKSYDGETDTITIRVRPAGNPNNNKQDVAHFFTDEATSSFIVERKEKVVTAGVHGRNEKPNTKADTVADKTRNTMVALGAIAGFSEVQWKKLVNGILGKG